MDTSEIYIKVLEELLKYVDSLSNQDFLAHRDDLFSVIVVEKSKSDVKTLRKKSKEVMCVITDRLRKIVDSETLKKTPIEKDPKYLKFY